MTPIDPFRIGVGAVAVAGAVVLLSKALPVLTEILWSVVPSILILALIFWVLKALVERLLS
jgi:hypothetical protein